MGKDVEDTLARFSDDHHINIIKDTFYSDYQIEFLT